MCKKINSVVLILIISMSCNKDIPIVNPLIGAWQYVYENYTECDNPVDNGKFDYPCDANDCFKITFEENYTLIIETLSGGILNKVDGSYSIEGPKVTICTSGCDDPVVFNATSDSLSMIHEDNAGCIVTTVLSKLS